MKLVKILALVPVVIGSLAQGMQPAKPVSPAIARGMRALGIKPAAAQTKPVSQVPTRQMPAMQRGPRSPIVGMGQTPSNVGSQSQRISGKKPGTGMYRKQGPRVSAKPRYMGPGVRPNVPPRVAPRAPQVPAAPAAAPVAPAAVPAQVVPAVAPVAPAAQIPVSAQGAQQR